MTYGPLPLFLLCFFQIGFTDIIETQQTVKAALGKDAHLYCQLTQSKDVVQVTWQKDLPNGRGNVCSYSKKSGPKVNPPFEGKVEFESAGLKNCSITIRNVTKQDESCYLCLFITVPDGALPARTCLMVYEQQESVLHKTIPENNKASNDGLEKKPGADESGLSVISVIVIIIAATVAVLLIVAVVFYICRKQKNRPQLETEEERKPLTPTKDPKDELFTYEDEQIRQRSPQKINQKQIRSNQ